ncbi:MAG: DUF4197 domain-containing protein [Rhodocyclaceae bacterium]|nr:DUF4197 domain-containing protein [Rhodocyclaceae bacterium]
MKRWMSLLMCAALAAPAWALDLAGLTQGEAAGGLKEALTQGAGKAVELLGQKNGYLANPKVKIPLPDALAKSESLLQMMGKGKDLDKLVATMNRAAEQAVPAAKPLLMDAIKTMSVDDAKRILSGGEDSVTRYFKEKTESQLATLFEPMVKEQTDSLAVSKTYNKLAGTGAGLGLVKQEDTRVEGYVTRKALDGLYLMIAEQEKAIRKDPVGAAGALARRVFGAL